MSFCLSFSSVRDCRLSTSRTIVSGRGEQAGCACHGPAVCAVHAPRRKAARRMHWCRDVHCSPRARRRARPCFRGQTGVCDSCAPAITSLAPATAPSATVQPRPPPPVRHQQRRRRAARARVTAPERSRPAPPGPDFGVPAYRICCHRALPSAIAREATRQAAERPSAPATKDAVAVARLQRKDGDRQHQGPGSQEVVQAGAGVPRPCRYRLAAWARANRPAASLSCAQHADRGPSVAITRVARRIRRWSSCSSSG